MAYHVPYARETFRPVNDMLPGNETADNPVEFDIVPAWGADLARIKSIVFASAGLVNEFDWSPETQRAVIAAFESGAPAFQNTITAIRGLSIPAIMAVRAGLLPELPLKADGTNMVPDPEAPYQVTTGIAFMRIVGALPAMGLHVASKIAKLSDQAEQDPRFFGQPSGSGGPGKGSPAAGSTAGTALPTSRRRGTAGRRSRKTAGQAGGS